MSCTLSILNYSFPHFLHHPFQLSHSLSRLSQPLRNQRQLRSPAPAACVGCVLDNAGPAPNLQYLRQRDCGANPSIKTRLLNNLNESTTVSSKCHLIHSIPLLLFCSFFPFFFPFLFLFSFFPPSCRYRTRCFFPPRISPYINRAVSPGLCA